MKCVDKAIFVSIFMSILSITINIIIIITDAPDFMKLNNSQLYHSSAINFTEKGDVTFTEDFHTLSYNPIFQNKSYTTRKIEGEDSNLFMSYQINFYDKNLMTFTNISLPNGINMKDNNEVEAHNLKHLDQEVVKIIHQDKEVLCYNTLIDSSVKCLNRKGI
ncbi:hypothetical protein [Vibrio parahaemolyticus]|uniref:hypothetical protein n=1 Tax=Vibrio parahaemolyticus TaxID=670 RepID=UPI0004966751|nr:hypothetical protein [Vibrio parahaemolyticus]MBE3896918.1 hypothetical protein [Vibrio parahaemolyticus]MBE4308865.1 hypothetical protein [Vibrio parahaemolyticus]MDF4607549.1 hypothetical protein [Vibrio parahaemolyticus]OUD69254.1 hypothetical protein BTN34_17295 [Vibrio parahaemolyticus]OUD70264.1 hypothetical protein BTN60_19165 [Vibrio parahaemolyticus]